MAGSDDDQSQPKTFDPTPRQLDRAREQGDVVQSRDLHTFALYVMLAVVLLAAADPLVRGIGSAAMGPLWHADMADRLKAYPDFAALVRAVAAAVGPWWLALLAILAVGPLVSLWGQRAVVFAGGNIQPKLSRISPIQNARNKYGPKGLVEFLKSMVKLGAVVAITAAVLTPFIHASPSYTGLAPGFLGGILHRELVSVVLGVTGLYAAFGAIDYLWQRHLFIAKHRMTRKDMEDEQKETEGNPHMKGKRRDRAVAIASNRMLFDTRSASVLVVNPEHYAVALKWQRGQGGAPVCVAKGVDHLALALRKVAKAHRVPIFRDPPLARLLHGSMEVGEEVDERHYQAVAVAIRFALKLQRQQQEAMRESGAEAEAGDGA
ncbi:MAG: flagellar biosynthesis protein FlhB [Alphaproteobacteria bacterium]|nr:flagellar biosynthesis protein FlhB [Alphaproteobacteria bacterium]MCB9928146.1 flagellar biosynthesis protein FlhB [Alphaproteobacteria bacterium]